MSTVSDIAVTLGWFRETRWESAAFSAETGRDTVTSVAARFSAVDHDDLGIPVDDAAGSQLII
jgi:hypothetical protein